MSDDAAPMSRPGVTAFTYNPSTGLGGGEPYIPLNGLNEVYIGAWLWIDPNFIWRQTGHEKVFYLGEANGGNLWTEVYGSPQTGPGYMSTVYQPAGGAANNCHLLNIVNADCPGSITFNYGGVPFTRGVYHRLEVYHKRSTSNTSRDGILRIWLDGTPVANVTQFNHTTGNPFQFFLITQAWDGGDKGLPNANQWRYDHIHISAPNSGGGSTPKGDTTPPAAPINLRAN